MDNLTYQVKWVGYEPTWEPIANLQGSANELLREYHETY